MKITSFNYFSDIPRGVFIGGLIHYLSGLYLEIIYQNKREFKDTVLVL